jgi:hypothetical protein
MWKKKGVPMTIERENGNETKEPSVWLVLGVFMFYNLVLLGISGNLISGIYEGKIGKPREFTTLESGHIYEVINSMRVNHEYWLALKYGELSVRVYCSPTNYPPGKYEFEVVQGKEVQYKLVPSP